MHVLPIPSRRNDSINTGHSLEPPVPQRRHHVSNGAEQLGERRSPILTDNAPRTSNKGVLGLDDAARELRPRTSTVAKQITQNQSFSKDAQVQLNSSSSFRLMHAARLFGRRQQRPNNTDALPKANFRQSHLHSHKELRRSPRLQANATKHERGKTTSTVHSRRL